MHLLTFSLPVMWLIILVVLALGRGGHHQPGVHLVRRRCADGSADLSVLSEFLDPAGCLSSRLHPVSGTGAAAGPEEVYPHLRPTNLDLLLGQYAVVTEDIDNLAATGQVKVDGQIWTARNEVEEPIPTGSIVQVLRIEGVKIIVRVKDSVSES